MPRFFPAMPADPDPEPVTTKPRRLRKAAFPALLGLTIATFFLIQFPALWNLPLSQLYDVFSRQEAVKTPDEVRQALDAFPHLSFEELQDEPMAEKEGLLDPKIASLYCGKTFLVVNRWNRFRFVADRFRMKEFLPNSLPLATGPDPLGAQSVYYVLLDPEILIKLLDLQAALGEQGYPPRRIRISSGFRDPAHNLYIGGVPKSRHLHGDALDIVVLDVNKDGRINSHDRMIVHKLLNERIIGDQGGVGTYAHQPRVIHFDTRGYRARWRG